MTQEHPITPPPELVQQWYDNMGPDPGPFESFAIAAARWGADEQLEMDATWVALQTSNQMSSKRLIAEMRPKPPSLKEQALDQLRSIEIDLTRCGMGIGVETIRRALEQLDD